MHNSSAQNIGINATGDLPNSKAMLDISSTTSGLLIPRMTTIQRDAIESPPIGLQIFNTTTNTLNIFRGIQWESVTFSNPGSNLVHVYSLADLPAPSGNVITLNPGKMYVFSGIINISPNYLNLNGAGLKGTDPAKDGVMSTVAGGVLRSTNVDVFIENLAVVPASGSTKAYDFQDASGTKFANLFSGCSVVEIGIPTLGVGQVSGFKAITTTKNYWNCSDGIKITGSVGKFASVLNFITNITSGSGIEFLSGLTIDDIDLSNNYFIYPGQTGVKVNAGSVIKRGRMTTNMFRGVANYLTGFDSYSPEWQMVSNTDIPNSRAFCFVFMNNNVTATSLNTVNTYYKIAGNTTPIQQKRFTAGNNIITYTGLEEISAKVNVVIGARAPSNGSDFSISIAKNGVAIPLPFGSMAPSINNQSFQLTLNTEISLSTNDYLEVFIRKNNTNTSSITIDEMQFRVTD
ncbi:MAG: hypothetical protein ACXWV4_02275 [Flavitalea sp.]